MMAKRSKLRVHLRGREALGGDLLLGEFRRFCDTLLHCLHRSEEIASSRPHHHLRHRIAALDPGSLQIALAPVEAPDEPPLGDTVYQFFENTVSSLEHGETVDPRLTNEDLQAFRELAQPMSRGDGGDVRIGDVRLSAKYIATIDAIIGNTIPSHGSVTGRLERLNLHNRNEFVLYPPISGFSITCVFEDGMLEHVRAAIKRTVTVTGKLTFRPDNPFPERVQVKQMEVHPPSEELPTLASLRGILRGGTGKLSTVEFLRSIRDE